MRTTVRTILIALSLSIVAFGQEAAVYTEQFLELRERANLIYRDLSDRDPEKRYPTTEEFLNTIYEPGRKALALSGEVNALSQTIQNSWAPGKGKKGSGPEFFKLLQLTYACGSLSLMLDALDYFVMGFGSDRQFLSLAAAQQAPMNAALRAMAPPVK